MLAGADACVDLERLGELPARRGRGARGRRSGRRHAVGGVPEIVHDGENGLLVPAGSADALAAALRRVVDEPGLRARLAGNARRRWSPSPPTVSTAAWRPSWSRCARAG